MQDKVRDSGKQTNLSCDVEDLKCDHLKCQLKYKYFAMSFLLLIFIMIPVIVLLVTLCSSHELASASGPVLVIDHDGGADDAMAIFISLLREKYFNGPKLIALTTNHGNVNESQNFINSQRILDLADRRDVLIYRGSTKSLIHSIETDYFFGKDGLGDNVTVEFQTIMAQQEHASYALIDLSKKYQGQLIVVAIGALTNIALAIRLDPAFIGRLTHLYVGAGTIYSAVHSSPEFNAEMDAEAYHIISEQATPEKVTFVPFSQIRELNITKEWRKEVLGSIPTKIMEAQNTFEQKSIVYSTNPQWSLLDPAVIGVLEDSSLINQIKLSNNSIVLCGDQRGIVTNDFTVSKNEANSNVIYEINRDQYEKFLIETFSAEL